MKLVSSWPRACFSLQVAEWGAENIRASDPSIDQTCVAARGANARAAGQQPLARTRRRALVWLLVSAMAALGTADAFASPRHKHVPVHSGKVAEAKYHKHHSAPDAKRSAAPRQSERARAAHMIVPSIPLPIARPAAASLPPDLAATKQAIELVRQGKASEATLIATSIGDPVAQKLVEWTLLRHPESEARFERYTAFIRANPNWPSIPPLRRRAEAKLWQDRRDLATVRRFFGEKQPTSPLGRLTFARMQKSEGNQAGAAREVRAVWRSAELSAELEAALLDEFGDELTRADHAARMDWRISAKDFGGAMRAAKRLGDDEVAIVKACAAAEADSTKVRVLLDAVPSEARRDMGLTLCRLNWLVRHNEFAVAALLVLAASPEDLRGQDTDEWWRERRRLARGLIDLGDPETAYRVVREAAPPANPYYRVEFHFMAGWIALRFLDDPAAALTHFAHVDEGSADPIVRARAAYWRGRAAEATSQFEEMRAQYEAAARYPTAYYGQLARARLGLGESAMLDLAPEPVRGIARELLHAADILYTIGERDLVASFVTEFAEESSDAATIAALGQLTAHYNDARAMLLIGKTALARGLAMDRYAFPDVGVPSYSPIGPQLDLCVVYSIVRTESAFDQRDKSPAKAVGLMQVTPEAGRDTAKRFGVTYDWNGLVSDPVYNTQMGAAEVAALLKEYRGSYIMTFAGYNAGRGRVRQWVAQHGDPRDPKVDAVDWVERIPIAETRNYVQRVLENLQVYRARFGAGTAMVEPNLHRAATIESRAEPVLVDQIPQ
jgi:soluble lytic murein transglycosylase